MRSATIVVIATIGAVFALVTYKPQTFGGFVGSNGALRTVELGPEGEAPTATEEDGSQAAGQPRVGSGNGNGRSSRSGNRSGEVENDASQGDAEGEIGRAHV